MSDFSELCPLFNTGVLSEVCFPSIGMTNFSGTSNALVGTLSMAASTDKAGAFTFGRTVIITGAHVRHRGIAVKGEMALQLRHCLTLRASGTIFGSITINVTQSFQEIYTWIPAVVTAKTFTSDDVLCFTEATGTTLSSGVYDLIVRYKEK